MQERALNLLRNLVASCPARSDVASALAWSGRGCELLSHMAQRADPAASHPAEQRVHALYTLVNVAAAGTRPVPFTR